jgi:hypothetical protein
MRRVETKRVAKLDGSGKLSEVGVQWGAERTEVFQVIVIALTLAAFATVFGFIWLLGASAFNPLLTWGFVGVLATGAALIFVKDEVVSLTFGADGRAILSTENGFYRRDIGAHSSITSIETRGVPRRNAAPGTLDFGLFGVVLVSVAGDVVWVTRHLQEESALKVAVQLTSALRDLRSERADGASMFAGQGTAAAKAPPAMIE